MSAGWRRPGVLASVLVAVVLGVVLARAAGESRSELRAAERHQRDGRSTLAILHYRRAIRWSLPLGSQRAKAISGLEGLAADLESAGDVKGALSAWRSVSGSTASVRTLYGGSPKARTRANREIARLVADGPAAGIDASLSAERVAADHLRLLDDDITPNPSWSILLLLGMAVWLISLFLLAVRGFDSAGRLSWPGARGPFWTALAGFGSFVLGLLFA